MAPLSNLVTRVLVLFLGMSIVCVAMPGCGNANNDAQKVTVDDNVDLPKNPTTKRGMMVSE